LRIKKIIIFDPERKYLLKPNIVKEYTDKEIIECLRNRQGYVVHYLSDRYMPMISMLVHENGGSNEDARDIFQDGLIIMLEKLDDNNFALTCKFKTFLYSVCENLWKNVLDRRSAANNYLVRSTEPVAEKDITEQMDNTMYNEIFQKAFKTLDPVSKKILKLYWLDKTPEEIAKKLGYTNGYVRKKKSEAQSELTGKIKNNPAFKKIQSTELAAKNIVH
jgi:RNA polymerase sigma factor (sigma-70 family)